MPSAAAHDRGAALLALYDDAVGEDHGYLRARCRNRTTAEDLTSEVFIASVDAVIRENVATLTTAWLIGIARHKLTDHWRDVEREQRQLRAVADEPSAEPSEDDPWDVQLDVLGGPRRPRVARRPPPRGPHIALPRRAQRPRGGRRARPHRPRHGRPARASQTDVP